ETKLLEEWMRLRQSLFGWIETALTNDRRLQGPLVEHDTKKMVLARAGEDVRPEFCLLVPNLPEFIPQHCADRIQIVAGLLAPPFSGLGSSVDADAHIAPVSWIGAAPPREEFPQRSSPDLAHGDAQPVLAERDGALFIVLRATVGLPVALEAAPL